MCEVNFETVLLWDSAKVGGQFAFERKRPSKPSGVQAGHIRSPTLVLVICICCSVFNRILDQLTCDAKVAKRLPNISLQGDESAVHLSERKLRRALELR